uniref:Uncharacterized protein n=1 Tax=Arundo donax TaxID=35708 RepID=A0A0A8YK32_ARUDO
MLIVSRGVVISTQPQHS